MFSEWERQVAETGCSPETKRPKRYKVMLINDDYTPMDFVIDVLKRFFYLSEGVATGIMLQVHQQGLAVCGVFAREIAEMKVFLVNNHARSYQHPLLCCMEPE